MKLSSFFPSSIKPFYRAVVALLMGGGMALQAQNTSPLDTAPGGAASAPAADSANAPANDSLVSNGNFELATQDPTWPDDWAKAKGISWQTENGKHFLRLVAQEPGKILMAYREIKIPSGVTNLEISVRFRTNGVAPGDQNWMDARTIFHFLDADRKPVSPDPKVFNFPGSTADWVVDTEKVAVPAGATTLVLMPALFKVQLGTLDLAEIRVSPVSP